MNHSQSVSIWQISRDFDWEGYISSHHITKHAGASERRICCPHCGESDYKCYVNITKGVFNCFKCDFRYGKYSLIDFVAKTENVSRTAAYARLISSYTPAAVTVADIKERVFADQAMRAAVAHQTTTEVKIPSAMKPLVPGEGLVYWEYLRSRGLTEREVLAGKVHYPTRADVPVHNKDGKYKGNLGGRVLWPVFGAKGTVSYQARAIKDAPIKYLTAPDSDLSHTLWPFVPPKNKHAVLVEGILDAYAGHRQGASFYACFGKKISQTQIAILKAWDTEEVAVFFDKKDALEEIKRAVERLKMHFKHVFVLDNSDWPKEVDPGDCLKLENGGDLIQSALSRRVDVYSLDYEKWKVAQR